MGPSSHESLQQELRSGSAEALGPFLELHRSDLLGFLKRITGDHLLTVIALEDLYQEVAASAWSALPKVSGPELDPLPWLFQLARRRVSDAYRFHFGAQRRSQSRVKSIDQGQTNDRFSLQELLVSSITSPSAVVSRNFRLNRVNDALLELGDDVATIVRMRYVDGLSTSEIAGRLNKTDVSVRVMLSRSLKKLTDMLGDG